MVFRVIGLIFNILLLMLAYQPANARVDYSRTELLILPTDLSSEATVSSTVQAILPASDLTGYSQIQVASKIIDNSIRYVWNNSGIRNTAVGQVAERVEKTVQVEKVVRSAATDGQKPIEHKFSFDLQGVQALAQLKYSGWIKAAIQYNLNDASASAEVSDRVFENKDLVLSQHISRYSEETSQVSLRWDW